MIFIVGFGFVGQAVYGALKSPSDAYIIDPIRGTKTSDKEFQKRILAPSTGFSTIDTIIVCVPSPSQDDGGVNLGAFAQVWDDIKKFDGLVIIKSTIPKEFIPTNDNVVYNPEFLNANTAKEDFLYQDYVVLGGTIDYTIKAETMYKEHFKLEDVYYEHCSKDEASNFKYIRNIYGAYKLLFWEFVQDTTGNSRKMAQMLDNIPVGEMDLVGMDGFRGFGGACLPKDTKAYDYIHGHKLTNFMLNYNKDLNDF